MAPKVAVLVDAQQAGTLPDGFNPLDAAIAGLKAADENSQFERQDKLVRYRAILEASFGPRAPVPRNADERDEYDLVKRKLERRISEIAGDPNTISAVAERYYKHNNVKLSVLRKYRRNIWKLINETGDIPISHVTSSALRSFRDQQSATLKPSSLSAVFTPIKGLFTFATDEELILANPMTQVALTKDKRSVHERKWKPFPPNEMQRLFDAMTQYWGVPMKGLEDERRVAIHMACRVMAHSALRPIEVVRLQPEDVTDEWITVRDSKTSSSF